MKLTLPFLFCFYATLWLDSLFVLQNILCTIIVCCNNQLPWPCAFVAHPLKHQQPSSVFHSKKGGPLCLFQMFTFMAKKININLITSYEFVPEALCYFFESVILCGICVPMGFFRWLHRSAVVICGIFLTFWKLFLAILFCWSARQQFGFNRILHFSLLN